MTLYLKTATEAGMTKALSAVLPGFVTTDADDNGALACHTHQWAVDWDIPIVSVAAVLDANGVVISAAIMELGFFANVCILDDSIDVSAFDVLDRKPSNPQRVFA